MASESTSPRQRPASESRASEAERPKPVHDGSPGGELTEIKQRLACAEREGRVMRRLAVAMFGLGLAAAIGAVFLNPPLARALSPRNVVTMPFRVVDAQGHLILNVDAGKGGAQLHLFGPAGQPVASLGATSEGGSLTVSGHGNSSAVLWANDDGGQLRVSNKDANPIACLGAQKEGGTLTFWNQGGHGVACLGTNQQGGSLTFWNQGGHGVACLGARKEGGTLTFWDHAGHGVVNLGANEQGGSLNLSPPKGFGHALLFANASGGQLGITDRAGQSVAWLAAEKRAGSSMVCDPAGKTAAQLTSAGENRKSTPLETASKTEKSPEPGRQRTVATAAIPPLPEAFRGQAQTPAAGRGGPFAAAKAPSRRLPLFRPFGIASKPPAARAAMPVEHPGAPQSKIDSDRGVPSHLAAQPPGTRERPSTVRSHGTARRAAHHARGGRYQSRRRSRGAHHRGRRHHGRRRLWHLRHGRRVHHHARHHPAASYSRRARRALHRGTGSTASQRLRHPGAVGSRPTLLSAGGKASRPEPAKRGSSLDDTN